MRLGLRPTKKKISNKSHARLSSKASPLLLEPDFIELLKKYKLRGRELVPYVDDRTVGTAIELRKALVASFFAGLFENDMDRAVDYCSNVAVSELNDVKLIVDKNANNEEVAVKINTITFSIHILGQALRWAQDFAQECHPWPEGWDFAKTLLSDDRFTISNNTAKALIGVLSNQVSAAHLTGDQFIQLLEQCAEKWGDGFSNQIDFLLFLHQLPKRPFNAMNSEKFNDYKLSKKVNLEACLLQLRRSHKMEKFKNAIADDKTRAKLLKLSKIFGYFDFISEIEQLENEEKIEISPRKNKLDDLKSTYKNLIARERYDEAKYFLKENIESLWPFVVEHVELCASISDYALLHGLIDINFDKLALHKEINAAYFNKLLKLVLIKHETHFLAQVSSYYNRTPESEENYKGYVICNMRDQRALRAMPIAALIEIRKQGWQVIQLNDKVLKNTSKIATILSSHNDKLLCNDNDKLLLDWKIDFQKREAITLGLNFWHGIIEHIRIGTRQYKLDFSQEKIRTEFMYRLRSSDKALHKLRIIIEHLKTNKPVRILIDNPHVTPAASLRLYVETYFKEKDISVVQYVNSYEMFTSEKIKPYSQAITIGNLTKHKLSHCRMGNKEGFEFWLKQNKNKVFVRKKRPEFRPSEKQLSFLQTLEQYKEANKKIYCLIGKTVFDFTDASAEGCVHDSFVHFVNDTVDFISKLENTVLLVKPHPQEQSNEIALYSQTGLSDLIVNKFNNVILLEPDQIPLSMLIPYLSLGILWSGSSVLDLSEGGVPHVSCNKTAENEMPLKTYVPVSLTDYHDYLQNPYRLIPKKEMQSLATHYLSYLTSDQVMVPYRFTNRPITNRNLWPTINFEDDFERYFSGKDPAVGKIVNQILK